jgi:CIC family chloride channel protein
VILLFGKLLATILTLGSGGSGGIFGPSLFMGSMLGAAFGRVANMLFPTITAPSGAYALVGMSAFFAGAAHAPVTAILILFELTGDYHIILPLMLATVMSTLVARFISSESIYTLKLTRRGVRLDQGQDIDVMQGVTAGQAMTTEVDTVTLGLPLDALAGEFARTHHHGFPVVDHKGNLAGVVTIQDLERARGEGPTTGRTVADIATREGLLVTYPYEPMWKALRRLGRRDVGRLPVVEHEGSDQLVGVVRRVDIVRAYDQAIASRAHRQHQGDVLRLGHLDGSRFVHLDISARSPAVGQPLSALDLPEACLIVSVRRGRDLRPAHGDTVLESGDRLTVFADEECVPHVRQVLTGQPEN